MAKCPAHDDHKPSLAIRDGRDGKVLFHCHKGCSQDDVMSALESKGFRDSAKSNKLGPIEREYIYTDEAGKVLYRVARYADKEFRQHGADGYGGWRYNMDGVRRVLYRLPEVLNASIVFVVEGEKDVETLRTHGFVATTNSGGAKNGSEDRWLASYTDALAGREVILIPDNDPAGLTRVLSIARAIVGRVASLVVLDELGVKDISDWFAAGHSAEELAEIVNRKGPVQ